MWFCSRRYSQFRSDSGHQFSRQVKIGGCSKVWFGSGYERQGRKSIPILFQGSPLSWYSVWVASCGIWLTFKPEQFYWRMDTPTLSDGSGFWNDAIYRIYSGLVLQARGRRSKLSSPSYNPEVSRLSLRIAYVHMQSQASIRLCRW